MDITAQSRTGDHDAGLEAATEYTKQEWNQFAGLKITEQDWRSLHRTEDAYTGPEISTQSQSRF